MTGFAAQFNHLFEELYQSVLQTEKRAFPDHRRLPLSASELCVLERIAQAPEDGITISDLAALLEVARPSASVAVNKLRQKGFVAKVPSQADGRSVLVTLTHEGKLACAYHSYCRCQRFLQLSHAYPDEEQSSLLRCMERLKAFLQTGTPPEGA